MDIYAKAKIELNEIDSQISTLQQRREALKKFIDLGDTLFGVLPQIRQVNASIERLRGVSGQISAITEAVESASRTAKHRILTFCRGYIETNGPTTTRQLIDVLESSGIEVSGSDKVATLSVLLSKSDNFQADRKNGWTLIDPHQESAPPDAPTSAGQGVDIVQPPLTGTGAAT
jgi:DNA-binding FrmR family transcriptional regulator